MFDVTIVKRGVERLRARRSYARRAATTLLTLADLHSGERARITCVQCPEAARCERLMAYGLAQGQEVCLLQTSPAYVVKVDETELALDAEVARCVQVESRLFETR